MNIRLRQLKLLGWLILLYVGYGYAQQHPTTFVIKTKTEQHALPVAHIHKITFEGKTMKIEPKEFVKGSEGFITSVDLNTVDKCYFSNDYKPTAIDEVMEQIQSNYVVYCDNDGMLHIIGLDESMTYDIAVISTQGHIMAQRTHFRAGEAIDVSYLNSGVHIVRINQQTTKFIKQ